jgi:hypothetical protein
MGSLEDEESTELHLPEGIEGFHLNFSFTNDGGDIFTVDQLSALDREAGVIYTFLIACEQGCYQKNRSTIQRIVRSWTIEEGQS